MCRSMECITTNTTQIKVSQDYFFSLMCCYIDFTCLCSILLDQNSLQYTNQRYFVFVQKKCGFVFVGTVYLIENVFTELNRTELN